MLDLSLHLLDIVENSVTAGASHVLMEVYADIKKNTLTIRVKDNGRGMSDDILARAAERHFTTKKDKNGGLGLALLKESAESAGGGLIVESEINAGTTVTAVFEIDHIARKPLGDIAATVKVLLAGHHDVDFDVRLKSDDNDYIFRTEDVRDVMKDVPLSDISVAGYIGDMIGEQITLIFGGILDEINS